MYEMWPFLDLDLQIQPCVSVGRNQQQVASHGICSDMPNHLLCFKPPGTLLTLLLSPVTGIKHFLPLSAQKFGGCLT